MKRAAVFLDRDGVLNRARMVDGKPYPPRGVADLELLPGVRDACLALRSAGLPLLVVTNQPDVARGTQSAETLVAIHQELMGRIPLDDLLCCLHDDSDGCQCRKPAPGLLLEAADRFQLSLERSVMVGDRWRDIEAGKRAGCATVFLDAGYDERKPEAPDFVAGSLIEAVPWILRHCTSNGE